MADSRIKINLFNQHFAYINKNLLSKLKVERKIDDISAYIRKKASQQFDINLKAIEDVKLLVNQIKSNHYDSASDWLREKVRSDLKLNKYHDYIDDMLCLDDIVTDDDIQNAKNNGFTQVNFTAAQFKKRFPLLETSKVFFNLTILHQTIYYDKEKKAIRDIPCGYKLGQEHSIDNLCILVPPNFDGPQEKSILLAIDYIYDALQNENYEFYTYMSMPLYRNELLDELIMSIDDEEQKKRLYMCKEIE